MSFASTLSSTVLDIGSDAAGRPCLLSSPRNLLGSLRWQHLTTLAHQAALVEDIAAGVLRNIAEGGNPEVENHLDRMRLYTQILAIDLGRHGSYVDQIDVAFLDRLLAACPLHDIGKMAIPDDVLLSPCRLTEEQFDIVREHTVIGWEILTVLAEESRHAGFFETAADLARHHHERFDGKGYPDGLAGEAISLEARIVAVADVFDALTSKRTYKDAMTSEDARRLILDGSGTQFDPAVVAAFDRCFAILVETRDGKVKLDGRLPRRRVKS